MTVAPLTCPECGDDFQPKHHRQQFCTPAHQAHFHQVNSQRGKVLLPLALAWRGGRNRKGVADGEITAYAFAELAALLDAYAREDKAAGRDPRLVVQIKRLAGWRAADLR